MEEGQFVEKWSSRDIITDYLCVSIEKVLKLLSSRKMPAHKVERLCKLMDSEVDSQIHSGDANNRYETEEGYK